MGDKVNTFDGTFWRQKEIGAQNGIAGLDGTGRVPSSQLPTSSGGGPSGDSGAAVAASHAGRTSFPHVLTPLNGINGTVGRIREFAGFFLYAHSGIDSGPATLAYLDPMNQVFQYIVDVHPTAIVTDVVVAAVQSDHRAVTVFVVTSDDVVKVELTYHFVIGPGTPIQVNLDGTASDSTPAGGRGAVIQRADGRRAAWFTIPSDSANLFHWDTVAGQGTSAHGISGATQAGAIAYVPGAGLVFATSGGVKKVVPGDDMTLSGGESFHAATDVVDIAWDGERVYLVRSSGQVIATTPSGSVLWTKATPQVTAKSRIECPGTGYVVLSGTSEDSGEFTVAWYLEPQTGRYVGTSRYDTALLPEHAMVCVAPSGHVAAIIQDPYENNQPQGATSLTSGLGVIIGMDFTEGVRQFQTASFTQTDSTSTEHSGGTMSPGGASGYVRRLFVEITVNSPTANDPNFELELNIDGTQIASYPFVEAGTGIFYVDELVDEPSTSGDAWSLTIRKATPASDAMDWSVTWGLTYSTEVSPVVAPPPAGFILLSDGVSEAWAWELDDARFDFTVDDDLGFSGDTYLFRVLVDGTTVAQTTTNGLTTGNSYSFPVGPGLGLMVEENQVVSLQVLNQTNQTNIPDWTFTKASFSVFGREIAFDPMNIVDGTLTSFDFQQRTLLNAPTPNWTATIRLNGSDVEDFGFNEASAPGSNGFGFGLSTPTPVMDSNDDIVRVNVYKDGGDAGAWRIAWDDRGLQSFSEPYISVFSSQAQIVIPSGTFDVARPDRQGLVVDRIQLRGLAFAGDLKMTANGVVWVRTPRTVIVVNANASVNTPAVKTVLVDTQSNPITISLTPAYDNDIEVLIKDATGSAATNPITVNGSSFTIDGSSTATISSNRGALLLRWCNDLSEWVIVSRYP